MNHARLSDATVQIVISKVETLCARALAVRHRSLVDNFCDQARDEGVKSVAVQPERYISVELTSGTKVAVVPTIGVPSASQYEEIERNPFFDGSFASLGNGFPTIVGNWLVPLNHSNITHLACSIAIWFVVKAKEALAHIRSSLNSSGDISDQV